MEEAARTGLREQLRIIVFEAETPAGKAFDVGLLWLIGLSILVVMAESVQDVSLAFGAELRLAEWILTGLFSVEYLCRLWISRRPLRYALSFFGIVDLLCIVPTVISGLMPGSQSLLVIRALRLLRIFRVLKLARLAGEANVLTIALRASLDKVVVFLGSVLVLVLILGSTMYLIEGEAHGFSSIPRAVYWAIVTMTTVGYGDIVPKTPLGQALSAAVMILGYAIIAVPTGIITAEVLHSSRQALSKHYCSTCHLDEHAADAFHCRRCGARLSTRTTPE